MIYTTNAIESIHARLRKIIKTRGHFPSDDAATELFWLAQQGKNVPASAAAASDAQYHPFRKSPLTAANLAWINYRISREA